MSVICFKDFARGFQFQKNIPININDATKDIMVYTKQGSIAYVSPPAKNLFEFVNIIGKIYQCNIRHLFEDRLKQSLKKILPTETESEEFLEKCFNEYLVSLRANLFNFFHHSNENFSATDFYFASKTCIIFSDEMPQKEESKSETNHSIWIETHEQNKDSEKCPEEDVKKIKKINEFVYEIFNKTNFTVFLEMKIELEKLVRSVKRQKRS